MRLYWFLFLSVLLLSNYVYATELQDNLSLKNGQVYSGFNYSAYSIEFTGGILSIKTSSPKLDTYLIIQSPDKSFHADDDSLGNSDAEITINEASSGKWMIIVTAYQKNQKGFFTLSIDGVTEIKRVPKGQIDSRLLEDAFLKRGVYSESKLAEQEEERLKQKEERLKQKEVEKSRKIQLLRDQLTLASYRTQLVIGLNRRIDEEDNDYTEQSKRLEALIENEKKLKRAKEDVKKLPLSSELLTEMLDEKIVSLSYSISHLSNKLTKQVSKNEAFSIALNKINKLDEISKKLEHMKQDLLNADDRNNYKNIKKDMIRLHAEIDLLTKEIAEKLFNSSLDEYLKLGAIDHTSLFRAIAKRTRQIYESVSAGRRGGGGIQGWGDLTIRGGGDFATHGGGGRVAMAVGRDVMYKIETIDPAVWLPELFPWPPPMASSRIVLDDYRNWQHRFKSLGEVDALIRHALVSTGYAGPSYFGTPNGFSLITQLEQIDGNGVPLNGPTRWSTKIAEMKRFSLVEYLKALVASQPGYYRVIAFIVSSEPFSTNGDRVKFSTIQHWAHSGFTYLPISIKLKQYSYQHRTTVLIYEFLKAKPDDEPSTSIPGRHVAQVHLKKTKLLSYLQ